MISSQISGSGFQIAPFSAGETSNFQPQTPNAQFPASTFLYSLRMRITQCFLLSLLFSAMGALAQNTGRIGMWAESGAMIPKSRISSAPEFLFAGDSAWWFVYRDGRNTACIRAIDKDLKGSKYLHVNFDPEHDEITAAGQRDGLLWYDTYTDERMRISGFRTWINTRAELIKTDTFFQWKRHFPMQKVQRFSFYEGDDSDLWYVAEQVGLRQRKLLYHTRFEQGQLKHDTFLLAEEGGELLEFLYAKKQGEGKLRLYLKKYDLRPVEKRAFSVNYTFGWMDVDLIQKTKSMVLLESKEWYLYDPCFKELEGDSMIIFGLYGNKDKRRSDGYFYFNGLFDQMAQDSGKVSLSFHPFQEDFWRKQKDVSEQRVLLRKKRLDGYYIRRYMVGEQGEVLMILQRLYTTDGGSIAGSQLYYHFKEMMLFQLAPNGSIQWLNGIAANQVLFDPLVRFGGFEAFTEGGDLTVFMNEHRRTTRNRDRRPKTFTRPAQARITAFNYHKQSGVLKGLNNFQPDYGKKMTPMPSSMLHIRNGQYLIFYEDHQYLMPVFVWVGSN